MDLAAGRTLLGLCRQAQREGVLHLKALLEMAESGDIPLFRYLQDRLREAREDLEEWAKPGSGVPGKPARVVEPVEFRALLKNSFPSRDRSFGEGPVERDVAMYLVECEQQEEAGFFRKLAARSPDEAWSLYFNRLAERQEVRLRKSREVLLGAGLQFAG